MPSLASYDDINICQKLSVEKKQDAGLLNSDRYEKDGSSIWSDDDEDDSWFWIIYYNSLLLVLLMMLLGKKKFKHTSYIFIFYLIGMIKALIGLVIEKVNKFGYNYVQPIKKYEYSSRYDFKIYILDKNKVLFL